MFKKLPLRTLILSFLTLLPHFVLTRLQNFYLSGERRRRLLVLPHSHMFLPLFSFHAVSSYPDTSKNMLAFSSNPLLPPRFFPSVPSSLLQIRSSTSSHHHFSPLFTCSLITHKLYPTYPPPLTTTLKKIYWAKSPCLVIFLRSSNSVASVRPLLHLQPI